MTVAVVAVKFTWQPASQSWPIETSDLVASAGTICAWRASGGNSGMSSSPSWVENMIVPLGLRMAIGLLVGRLLRMGAVMVTKCVVAPVSAIMDVCGASDG